jgi:hypothetical protein
MGSNSIFIDHDATRSFPAYISVPGSAAEFIFAPFLMPSYKKIKQCSDRREYYQETEPDDLIRIVRELASNNIDDRYQPYKKERKGYYQHYRSKVRKWS